MCGVYGLLGGIELANGTSFDFPGRTRGQTERTPVSGNQANVPSVPGLCTSILGRIFGFGSSLHVPGPGGADPSTYGVDANGNFTFTTHIDSAYATWHTPIGALIHFFTDVRGQGAHRKPC